MSSRLHPDSRLNPSHTVSNESSNPSIAELVEQRQITRRQFLKTSLGVTVGATAMSVLGASVIDALTRNAHAAPAPSGAIGFTSVPPNVTPMTDAVSVPYGYTARVLIA